MDALTYGDRRKALELLAGACIRQVSSDEALVERTQQKLLLPVSAHGLEGTLIRGAVELCYLLLYSPLDAVKAEARAALHYLVLEADAIPDALQPRGLDDDVYVLHRTIQCVRKLAGASAQSLAHPYLVDAHILGVESALAALRNEGTARPAPIIQDVIGRIADLRQQCPAELTDELERNAAWLQRASTESSDPQVAEWASAALKYISGANSVIDEAQGSVAILVDLYATHLALKHCKAPRAAVIDALDRCTHELPLLDLLALRDETARSAASEYTLINLAAAQRQMEAGRAQCLLIHVPVIGGTPLQVALLAAVGRIHRRREELTRLPEFKPGALVQIIQGERKAVGRFQGYEVRKGISGLVVKDERVTMWFPLTPVLLSSISLASKGKPGGLHRMSANVDNLPVSALDLLLDIPNPLRMELAGCEVLFVCNSMTRTRELMAATSMLRTPLTKILPVGPVQIGDDEREGWSDQWHATPPVLAVTSSLFDACAYLNAKGQSACRLVVIEDAGHWENSADLLMDLATGQVPVLAFGAYADEAKLRTYAGSGFKQARWDVEELEQLSWHAETPRIAAAEARIRFGINQQPHISRVGSISLDRVGPLLEQAGQGLADCGGDTKADLALGAAWTAFTRASRWPLPVTTSSMPIGALQRASEGLTTAPVKRHLSTEAAAMFDTAAQALSDLAQELVTDNPKWHAYKTAVQGAASVTLIAANDRAADDMRQGFAEAGIGPVPTILTARQIADEGVTGDQPVVIPGWYRSDVMTRLLNPPAGRSTHLLLWGFEQKHHERWKARQEQVHTAPGVVEAVGGSFRRNTRRTTIVVPPAASLPPAPDDMLQNLELKLIRASARRAGESSRQGASAGDLVDAVVVTFKDGQFAFFERDGSAQAVTDVLRAPPEQAQSVRVRYKPVSELSDGDLVLFHTGSEADAIRSQADLLMESEAPGSAGLHRTEAALWQQALVRYRDAQHLSAVDVAAHLAKVGCRRNVMTVRKWLADDSLIGPQSYTREVEQILSLTQDPELRKGLKQCVAAIGHLRGKHLQASTALAKALLHKAGQQHNRLTGDFGGGLVVAEVNLVDTGVVQVARRALRRLNQVDGA